jgi:hypothetical protein
MLDLNVYYVLALNEDASISAMILILVTAPSSWWSRSPGETGLTDGMTSLSRCRMLTGRRGEYDHLKVVSDIDVGARPSRLVLSRIGTLWWL